MALPSPVAEPTLFGPLRLFVPPEAFAGGHLALDGTEATRAYQHGVRAGTALIALDDSGWEMTVVVEEATADHCRGVITGRSVADEKRTKVSVYQGLLHPSDFRRLLTAATAMGVVSFIPTITDESEIPAFEDGDLSTGDLTWHSLVRDTAEASGRGRRPTIGTPLLFDHALDEAARAGLALLVDPRGGSLLAALSARPFAVAIFCPPPAGFTPDEVRRAEARHVAMVAAPVHYPDPIRPALGVIEAIYAFLET